MCAASASVWFFFFLSSFFLFFCCAFTSSNRNHQGRSQEGCGQVEEVRRATKHSREGERERDGERGGSTESDCDE